MADRQVNPYEIALRVGLPVAEAQQRSLDVFWRLLLTWNARINLTGARSREELIGEHLPDALAMARLVPPGAQVLDIGSGGGLPALPFALLRPDAIVAVVEPRAKRVAFLRTAVRELGLAVEVVAGRLEALGGRSADVASSRATFAPGEWLERARVVAPRALVFASRQSEVLVPAGVGLEEELTYETAAGHGRWLGLFRST